MRAEEALKPEEIVSQRRARGARASVCGRGDLEVAEEERLWRLQGSEDLTPADKEYTGHPRVTAGVAAGRP
jgi:hypothetical protein